MRIPITQMEYTLTHQKTELSQILQDDNRYGVPNKHFPNTKRPQCQTHVGTNWQNAQIAPRAHKWSSTLKCPNSTSCSEEKFAQVHTGRLSLGACQLFPMHVSVPPRKKPMLAVIAQHGRNRENPRNKWFQHLLGTSPQVPSQDQLATSSGLITTIPACRHGWQLYSGKPQGARYHESAASHWEPKSVTESGTRCSPLKSQ